MTVYATSSDFTTYTGGDTPVNIDSLLRSASRLVARQIRASLYVTDSDGNPTDTDVVNALRDATCEQAVTWQAAGVDPASSGLLAQSLISSKSLDGGSVSYDNSLNASVTAFQARQVIASTLSDQAALILEEAGLGRTRIWNAG